MTGLLEKFEAIFAAAAFAEYGEWDEAVRIADGSLHPEKVQPGRSQQSKTRRTTTSRPRPRR